MATRPPLVSQKRNYLVPDVSRAKEIAVGLLTEYELREAISFGLPEVDDRYHVWRVPLRSAVSGEQVGEIVIDARTSLVRDDKSTSRELLEARLLKRSETPKAGKKQSRAIPVSTRLRNTVAFGDSAQVLLEAPAECVDLVFTSPPYFNARVEYSEYLDYQDYLLKLRRVIQGCFHTLREGRFLAINTAPVLVRRASRNEASRRIAVPFDVHGVLIEEGFEFIDDIIWVKPEGAGWATGRGRRFAADRNPLQYKAVPVTEYVLVYRKKSDKLIDWHIRNAPPDVLTASKIPDGYERTNIWRIHPATHADHPAVFPMELAENIIKYYSFVGDVILDPFAGTGTVGAAAVRLDRRFFLVEKDPNYLDIIREAVPTWLGKDSEQVLWSNCVAPPTQTLI